jgi:alpha-glucosidase
VAAPDRQERPGRDGGDRTPWWRDAVLYQVYPRSFADSNGDGIGDLRGIRERLDYLQWLGVDGVWLNPTFPSPNADWGYDVADYLGVHPDLGTLADLDSLVAEAGARGIAVLLDLVPAHTSDRHPWFADPRRRDWYVWTDRPTNWRSAFGGTAWTRQPATGRFYLHTFFPEQPDLNWWNPEVREAFDEIVRFWLDRGLAGFRIDVAHRIVKSRRLVDLPAGTHGRARITPTDLPETHAVLRRWRAVTDRYDGDRVLVGETYVDEVAELPPFYGSGHDELQLAFNIPFARARFEGPRLRRLVAETERVLPPGAWPTWTGSNHDIGRLATRWCGGDEERARSALTMLLTLRGTPFLYYGDELALEDVAVPAERRRDHASPSRDGCRTPMPWEHLGGWQKPWLPLGDCSRNVQAQLDDPSSTLSFTRALLALRRSRPDLRRGEYEELTAPRGVWAWRRGERTAVALSFAARPARLALDGRVLLSTRRDRDGDVFDGRLRAGEAVVLDLG